MPVRAFRHLSPATRIYYGPDSVEGLRAELDKAGCSRAVVFCGQTLANHPDGLKRLIGILDEKYAGCFDQVQSHSPLPSVMDGVNFLRDSKADAVVALGGGSPIVSARAATIIYGEGRDIGALHTRFEPGKTPVSPRLHQFKLPQFAIPTTPTTAYAKAGTAVLGPAQGKRLTMLDPQTRTRAVFIDTRLAPSAPSSLVRDSALNTFSMTVQGLESSTREPLADADLLHALRLSRDNIPLLGTESDTGDVRGNLMLAAALTGRGTDHATIGIASAIGHCLAARQHIPNGTSNAILLPHTIRFNGPSTGDRLSVLGEIFGGVSSEDGSAVKAADMCAAFLTNLGVPMRLRDVGLKSSEFDTIVDDVSTDWFLYQNPRNISEAREILPILDAAY